MSASEQVPELGHVTADLVVLTVLPEEYAAVLACLREPKHLRGTAATPNTCAWQLGMIASEHYGAPFKVAVGMGTATTTFGALAASQAIGLFDPPYIAFVGVAGGFDRDGQRHGDVAVSSVVTAYEYGKVDTGGFTPRGNFTYRCNEALVRAADAVNATGAVWWDHADNPAVPPRVRTGMIASGDKVIDDSDEAFFAAVHAAWPKLLAVEMEGAGVAAAVHEVQGQRAVGFILVRGISDMPHPKAPGALASTAERDGWKVAASRNAARFLAHLVATAWPVPPRAELVSERLANERKNDLREGSDKATVARPELAILNHFTDEAKGDSRKGSGKDAHNQTRRWGNGLAALAGMILIALFVYGTCRPRRPVPVDAIVLPDAPQDAPLQPDTPQDAPLQPDAPQDAPPRPDALRDAAPDAPSFSCPPDMARVHKGVFRMGTPPDGNNDVYSRDYKGEGNEHMRHLVTLSEYCIDKTEVTVKAYAKCVASHGCAPPLHTVDVNGGEPGYVEFLNKFCNGDDKPMHPINCVSWEEADKYCTTMGRRLPTEAEWEYAARGEDGLAFPWEEGPPNADRLNARIDNLAECPVMSQESWKKHVNFKIGQGCATTTPVGSFPKGKSPFGALDMAGNVWEWTADVYEAYEAIAVSDPIGPKPDPRRSHVMRGGCWNAAKPEQVRTTVRNADRPTLRNIDLGFRCAWPPRKTNNSGPSE